MPHTRPLVALILAAGLCLLPGGPVSPVGAAPAAGIARVAALPALPARLALPMLAADGLPPPSITLAAVGDISLARGVVTQMAANGPDYPFARVSGALAADITVGNLEGALTDSGEAWPKAYNFRTPPSLAGGLVNAGFDVLSLANNHTLDYGVPGLEDTLATLAALGIRSPGGGASAGAARAPAIVQASGLRVAFLAYALTPDEFGGFSIFDWAAGDTSAGVAIGSAEVIALDVASARASADFVVVLLHAGDEYSHRPNSAQRSLAAAALDAGADAFIGAHPHVVQTVEQRGRQVVAWSLGNFVFDLDAVDRANIPRPRVTLVLRLTLTRGEGVTGVEVVAITEDEAEGRPRPATPGEAAVLYGQVYP